MREHGIDSFEFVVVEQCESEEASYEAEVRWIRELNSTCKDSGYNRNAGGRGPLATSEAVRAKIAAALTGKRHSPELVEKRAASHRGKKRDAQAIANLSQSDLKYRHITPEMCWELYSQGMSGPRIADRLGVKSYRPIYRLLKLGGYPLRPPGQQASSRRRLRPVSKP
jgi:hypothetical protein